MANLRIRVMLPPGFDAETLPRLKRTLSAQPGVELEVQGNNAVVVIKDGTSLKAIKGAKLTLEQHGIRFAVPRWDMEADEDYVDDGSPLPEYAEDCDCEACRAARYKADRRRVAVARAQAQQAQAQQAAAVAQVMAAQEQTSRDAELKRLLEEAVLQMNRAKRRVN